ncbi:MAG: Ig-like domain-containing protein [Planctomycetes bacterium]|nr:Ig-like domain-containing protein [Planctomycetota bacterium]
MNGVSSATTPVAITAATEATNVVTITAANGFVAGDLVQISGVVPGAYNGVYRVVTATAANFTVFNPTGLGGAAGTAFGTVRAVSLVPRVVTAASEAGNIVTVTTAAPHNYQIGQLVEVAGTGPGNYNGVYKIATTPTATTFTYVSTITGLAAATVFGTTQTLDGGLGGAGGDAGLADTSGGGANGGAGGQGGNSLGGGVAVISGALTVDASKVQDNLINEVFGNGQGGSGGNATPATANKASKVGGIGGTAGNGGTAFGGGIYADAGTGKVTFSNGSILSGNHVDQGSGDGGVGGVGGSAQVGAGKGGDGGAGGVAGGAGAYVVSGDVVFSGASNVSNNFGSAGFGGTAGVGGVGYGAAGAPGVGGAGGAGGAGALFQGGGVFAGKGNITITGGIVSGNTAHGGNGALGANGGGGGAIAGGRGGVGGAGGAAGTVAQGAGVYAKAGNVTLNGGVSVQGNSAAAGAGGNGGLGGVAAGSGGAGGAGGAGGKAAGGGVYALAGNVSLTSASVGTNKALGGKGGDGQIGQNGAIAGGAGGNGGAGGSGAGGGIANAAGDVTLDTVSKVLGNQAFGGNAGVGAAGGTGGAGGNGGAGGAGGAGGVGHGGGIWALNGAVTIQGGSQLGTVASPNIAKGGAGKNSGAGGLGAVAGAGTIGGAGGEGTGGGAWVQDGSVKVSGSSTVNGNQAIGGFAGDGGNRGAGGGLAINGDGGLGGLAAGGGIWTGTAGVTVTTGTFQGNTAKGARGGFGASGAVGGVIAQGGAGGASKGGAIFSQSGDISATGATFTLNTVGTTPTTVFPTAIAWAGGVVTVTVANTFQPGDTVTIAGFTPAGYNGTFTITSATAANFTYNLAVNPGAATVLGTASVAGGAGGKGGLLGIGVGQGGKGGDSVGGAIAIGTGTLTLTTDNLNTNKALVGGVGGGKGTKAGDGGASEGGAVWAGATAKGVTISQSSFFLNTTGAGGASGAPAEGTGGDSEGGAIYATSPIVSITNSTIAQNNTGAGGAGAVAGNSVGGGVYVNSPAAKIHNSTIVYNAAIDAGGGIRNDGTLELVSTIVGRNSIGAPLPVPNIAVVPQVGPASDISNTGTLTGDHNLIESNTGFTIAGATNIVGKSFLNPTFNQTGAAGGSQNTVFVDSAAAQTATNGTQYFRLVTPAEFTGSAFNPAGKLPVGALTALDKGSNPDNLTVDQIDNPRVAGLAADVGSIEGNGSTSDTQGAFVVSSVFSTSATGTPTFDTITVTFNEAIDPTSFSTAQILSLTGPDGANITPTSVTPVAGSGNTAFTIRFPNSDILGKYTLLLSQTIRDTAVGTENQMDDNKNGINGEAAINPIGTSGPGDQDQSTGILTNPALTSGAAVTSAVFSGTGTTFNKVRITFDQPIDTTTFTTSDVTIVSGVPGGPTIFVTGVTLVAGTANTFDVTFTPAAAGPLVITLSTDILNFGGAAGLPMNQNGNAINGEAGIAPAGDQFQSSTDTQGANITKATFSGAAANTFDTVELVFNEGIDPASFTTADITLTGPGGAITPAAVTLKAGTTDTFDVTFPSQTTNGTYTITTSVDILDFAGNQMDQNLNMINGEPGIAPTGDQFQSTASIGSPSSALLAVGGSDGTVRIIDGATGTVLSTVRPLDVPGSPYNGLVSVALGDFDGDGGLDLAVASANPIGVAGLDATKAGKVFVYDDAGLASGILTLDNTITPFANTNGPAGTTGAYLSGLNIAAGDVNNDGKADLVAGTRGGTVVEFGRVIVIDGTTSTTPIGSGPNGISPFGSTYTKGVVVAAGDLDGANGDEIAVTRGGPVVATNPNQTVKLKAYQLSGGALTELALSGSSTPLAPFAGIGSGANVIKRDARVAFTDIDGDGKAELVFSALDPLSTPGNTTVRIAAFSVNLASGLATPISTGTGPSNSYTTGSNIVDHAISGANPTGTAVVPLALITESANDQVQYLNPLNGTVLTGGFALPIVTGGITISGI